MGFVTGKEKVQIDAQRSAVRVVRAGAGARQEKYEDLSSQSVGIQKKNRVLI